MSTQVNVPGYVTGTWVIDPARSEVSFQVRQFGFAKARGNFEDFEGTIVTTENPLDSSVTAVIRTASVNTRSKRRDDHLRTDDFLAAETYPTMTFTSTGVRIEEGTFLVDGDLTVRAVTKQVTLHLTVDGVDTGSAGRPTARLSAHTEISRNEFGVTGGGAGAVIGDKVTVTLQIVADKQD